MLTRWRVRLLGSLVITGEQRDPIDTGGEFWNGDPENEVIERYGQEFKRTTDTISAGRRHEGTPYWFVLRRVLDISLTFAPAIQSAWPVGIIIWRSRQ